MKQLVAEYDNRLTIITDKISDLEADLQILNDEKRAVLECIEPFKRALSPFRQLPDDIVREVFIACLETERNPTMSNTEAPVLLTHISSATRRIALTTPALWASIHIPIPSLLLPSPLMDRAKSAMAARTKGVEEWLLRRSGSLPLHISFHNFDEHGLEFSKQIVSILLRCCSRWRYVHFSCPPESLSCISSSTPTDFPALLSLSIDWDDSGAERDTHWKTSSILTAPNLHRLSVTGTAKISDYLVNWSNLTHLTVPDCSPLSTLESIDDLARILRQTTRLISCRLSIPCYQDIPPSKYVEEISLPFLKVLIIYERKAYTQGILGSIHAPALEAVQYNSVAIASPPDDLISLLKRTPNIQEFSMGRPQYSHIISECLRHCPSLKILYVWGLRYSNNDPQPINDAFLEAFVQDDKEQCICPQLEFFRCKSTLKLSLNALHRFIMRKNGTSLLLGGWRTVHINVRYDPADNYSHYIDELGSKDFGRNMNLLLTYTKQTFPWRALDVGISDRAISRRDSWWPSKLLLDI